MSIDRSADHDAVQAAYRAAVKQLPVACRNAPDDEQLLRLNQAREVLSDPAKRRLYDASLSHGQPMAQRLDDIRQKADAWVGRAVDAVDVTENLLGDARTTLTTGKTLLRKLRDLLPG